MRRKALLYSKRYDFLTRLGRQPDALKHPSPCRRARTILFAFRYDRQTFPYFFLFRTCRADYQPPLQPQAKTRPARCRQNQRVGAARRGRRDTVLVSVYAVFQTHSGFVLTEKMPSETLFFCFRRHFFEKGLRQEEIYNRSRKGRGSALARFKTRIAFADDVNFAPASDDLAVAVALFGGFE